MDSLTQVALGAAVGEAVLGRKVGRKAALWGAVCGTMPDLDVFVPMGDPIKDFTYHRSFSHSIFVLSLLTPLIVWLILKLHPKARLYRTQWIWLVWLCLITHVLLDSFTVYGTQIFWPLWTTPMTWSSIFIIDPLYTLPLLFGVIAALVAARRKTWGHKANWVGLVLSSLYLTWTVGAKLHVEQVADRALAQLPAQSPRVLTTPAPLNSLLWRILVVDDEHYYEGFYSLLDEDEKVRFERYPRSPELLDALSDSWPVRRLQWFTKGFYAASLDGGDIVFTDLRMGLEPEYVFRFKVGELGNPHPRTVPVEGLTGLRDYGRLRWVWARIWDAQAQYPQGNGDGTAGRAFRPTS